MHSPQFFSYKIECTLLWLYYSKNTSNDRNTIHISRHIDISRNTTYLTHAIQCIQKSFLHIYPLIVEFIKFVIYRPNHMFIKNKLILEPLKFGIFSTNLKISDSFWRFLDKIKNMEVTPIQSFYKGSKKQLRRLLEALEAESNWGYRVVCWISKWSISSKNDNLSKKWGLDVISIDWIQVTQQSTHKSRAQIDTFEGSIWGSGFLAFWHTIRQYLYLSFDKSLKHEKYLPNWFFL